MRTCEEGGNLVSNVSSNSWRKEENKRRLTEDAKTDTKRPSSLPNHHFELPRSIIIHLPPIPTINTKPNHSQRDHPIRIRSPSLRTPTSHHDSSSSSTNHLTHLGNNDVTSRIRNRSTSSIRTGRETIGSGWCWRWNGGESILVVGRGGRGSVKA